MFVVETENTFVPRFIVSAMTPAVAMFAVMPFAANDCDREPFDTCPVIV
jgi:hypothetical protein